MKRRCRLINAPTGLFIYKNTLAMKTEYTRPNGCVEAYIVSSGETFCASQDAHTVAEYNNLMVTPIKFNELQTALSSADLTPADIY